jgi:DNA polymerase-3 subunit alpha
MEYVSLHHHTTFSYKDGAGTPEAHVERAAQLGYAAMAVTEHGNVSSHFPFERAALAAGIKPLFGIEAYTGSSTAKQQAKWHLTVLAGSQEGYRNLNALVTQSWKDHHYHPTVIGDVLTRYRAGLTVLSGCSGSLLACTLTGGKGIPEPEGGPDFDGALRVAERFASALPDYYLEVQAFPELESARVINTAYQKISRLTGIPLVATMDVHYPRPEDSDLQVILHACGPQGRGTASADEMLRRWNYDVKMTLPDSDAVLAARLEETGLTKAAARAAIENTARIAASAAVTLPKAGRLRFPLPDGTSAADALWGLLRDGWKARRIGSLPRSRQDWYEDRIRSEMKLILDKDFADYFLAMSDAIRWAKGQGIAVGPGRGSAAASVICWLTRITEIDPGQYPGMMFERFIDATREDMPDIDIDIEDERRPEVRDYMAGKYGEQCVGTLANFVGYRGKLALADVARVYRVPKVAREAVSSLIVERASGDARFDDTIEDTVEMFPAAREVFERFPALWLAARLEGNMASMSVHAAGLVVSNTPLTDICAVYEREGRQVLSVNKAGAEYAGMLKMDFLGLSTMSVIARCLEWTGLSMDDLYALSDDDPDALGVFRDNDIIGIFQFDGPATRDINRMVKPDTFLQVADISALSRPGPLYSGTTDLYYKVKTGQAEPDSFHPVTDQITAATFGQIIYQEQILAILRDIGGFGWERLSEVRRIIQKKSGQAVMQALAEEFIAGAARLHGMDDKTAARIWSRLVTCASYAFNIAHTVSYSVLSWWLAWLKARYPAQFYAASLARTKPASAPEFRLLKDAQQHGITIRPPSLKLSMAGWTPDGEDGVLAGFKSAPGISDVTAAGIVREREREPFGWWRDVARTRGVGQAKIDKIQQFCDEDPDPFELGKAARLIGAVTDSIASGEIRIPPPRHDGAAVAAAKAAPDWLNLSKGTLLTYAGVVTQVRYRDVVEAIHARTGQERDEILAGLSHPELTRYAILRCADDTLEEVTVRVNRFAFPEFGSILAQIVAGHDVLIATGRKAPGFGSAIQADELYVIDPDC